MFTSSHSSRGRWMVVLLGMLIVATLGFLLLLPRPPRAQPNVLWITVDSLRPDHLGCYGYKRAHSPNIDALARDGTVFREALAQGTYTRISVPSMITSKRPCYLKTLMLRGKLDSVHTTLAELLSADGYGTFATARLWSMSFYQGFDKTDPPHLNTLERTDRAIHGLDDAQEGQFFIWLYYWDPHAPYEPPKEFMRLYEPTYIEISHGEIGEGRKKASRRRDGSGHYSGSIDNLLELNAGKIRLTTRDRQHLINLYDAEIAYVDSNIGRVMSALKKRGLYDNTLIVLNADHGEGFGEHQKYFHGTTVYDEMAKVPLIIKPPHPQKKKKVIWAQVRNLDIMPTILDYCGLEMPENCDGQSLRPFIEGDASADLPSVTETHMGQRVGLVAFRHQAHKAIYNLYNRQVWLYNLRTDPEEKSSLLPHLATFEPLPKETSDPVWQKEQQMRQELMDLLSLERLADLAAVGEDLLELDEKNREQLKALGYVY